MKIAIAGKGGVGKTTIAAALAMLFSGDQKNVVAIDADPDSNLASALGVPKQTREQIVSLSQMYDLIEERTGVRPGGSYGALFSLTPKVDDLLDRYAVDVNGVKLMVLGTIKTANSGCFCPENALLKAFLNHLILNRDDTLLMDMEAGLEHLGRGTTKNINILLVIVEPGMKSLETAQKIKMLAKELGIKRILAIANKVRTEEEKAAIKRELKAIEMDILGSLPYDEEVSAADLADTSLPADGTFFNKMKKIKERLAPKNA